MPQDTDHPEPSISKQSTPVRRACDCCRKRKVKCDGEIPCTPCKKAAIRCAYLQPPKKKGPKGLRSAQVLRALRDIGDAAPSSFDDSQSPIYPQDGYSQWSLSSESSPTAGSCMEHESADKASSSSSIPGYGVFSTAPQTHFQPFTLDSPATAHMFREAWTHTASQSHGVRPAFIDPYPMLPRIENARFHPYVQLFFNHLFPIMPIIDPLLYLDHHIYEPSNMLTLECYAFFCALSAATIIQLESSVPLPPFDPLPGRPAAEADMFAEECLRTRRQYDYVRYPTKASVMTSFFMFAYYGNKEGEKSERAWHYLQESITFAEILDLDDERVVAKADSVDAQWTRRLYWLLFITERAYAIQRHKNTRLRATLDLPLVLEAEDPRLLSGFVNLIHLFSAIGDNFVTAWRGMGRHSLCSAPWLADTQRSLDMVALAVEHITETQRLDISISREWLHVLAWQMGVSHGLVGGQKESGMRLEYPVDLARRVVRITEEANPIALDSHGIGMEQKLSDIGSCLADVLRCTAGDMSATFTQGREYLHLLVNKLSMMRGKESRYFRPLLLRVDSILDHGIPQTMLLPESATTHEDMKSSLSAGEAQDEGVMTRQTWTDGRGPALHKHPFSDSIA